MAQNFASAQKYTVVFPQLAVMWHDEAAIVVGNALTHSIDTSRPYNTYSYQNAAAINDSFSHGCFLDSGTYDLWITAWTASDAGILKMYVDDIYVGLTDLYWPGALNVRRQYADIVIPTPGWHTITGLLNTKNGTSTGYGAKLIYYTMSPS